MQPNFLVPVALTLFIPATVLCIQRLGAARGVMAALLAGWMFLPVFDGRVDVPVLATKMSFVSTVIVVVAVAMDMPRWLRLRPHPVDLVAGAVCVLPFATAIANGLGSHEGLSASLQALCSWGTPYLLGRVYLGAPRALAQFARWLVGAAMVYVPLCLWEIRMSPQLHRQLYGFHTFESFAFAVRYGGYRPTVFMQFGLMVGTFMATGTLIAYWLWRSRGAARLAGMPARWCVLVLAATTVLVKSTGAVLLLAVGIGVLESTRVLRRSLLILVLMAVPVAFVAARVSGWDASQLVEGAALIGPDRAQSVSFRIANEQLLVNKALQRPWLGWGRWGRSRIYDEDHNDISVTDSLWVIALGVTGILGLGAFALMMLVPTLLLMRRFPARRWNHPAIAPAAGLALGTVLWIVDCLLNSMTSPLFPAMSGALATFTAGRWQTKRRPVATEPAAPLPPEPRAA